MQMVKKSLFIILAVWIAIIVLMPKQEFYFKLEQELAKHEIVLNEEQIDDGLFSLRLKQVTVYFKGINVATIEEVKLATLLFYSCMDLKGVEVDDSLRTMVPQKTENAVATHSIFDPLKVSVEASGSFGGMSGKIDLTERNVRLDFNESKNIEMLKPQLKKAEKGWIYETSF